jgi:hypothetical protein
VATRRTLQSEDKRLLAHLAKFEPSRHVAYLWTLMWLINRGRGSSRVVPLYLSYACLVRCMSCSMISKQHARALAKELFSMDVG